MGDGRTPDATSLGRFPKPVVDGCVGILAELQKVPLEHRLDAFALAADAAIKTAFWHPDRLAAFGGSGSRADAGGES